MNKPRLSFQRNDVKYNWTKHQLKENAESYEIFVQFQQKII